jgi:hypothetical protein
MESDQYFTFQFNKNSKFQWFQYRIINKILATNTFLFQIKKVKGIGSVLFLKHGIRQFAEKPIKSIAE